MSVNSATFAKSYNENPQRKQRALHSRGASSLRLQPPVQYDLIVHDVYDGAGRIPEVVLFRRYLVASDAMGSLCSLSLCVCVCVCVSVCQYLFHLVMMISWSLASPAVLGLIMLSCLASGRLAAVGGVGC